MLSIYTAFSIFIVSFVSNALPFFGEAYTVYAVLILLRSKATISDILILILITALGASISKNISYTLGIALRRPLRRTSAVKLIRALSNKAPLWVLTLILSALPGLPLDDYLYISGGAARINALKLNLYILLGKLVKSSAEIPIEFILFNALFTNIHRFGIELYQFQVLMAIAFTVLGIIIFKIDWIRIYEYLSRHINFMPRIDEN